MQINIVCCLYVLVSEKNENIRKNNVMNLKVVTTSEGGHPSISFTGGDMKKKIRDHIKGVIGSNIFHLEQVYTMSHEKSVDVIYLAITNMENVLKLKSGYELNDFRVLNNSSIVLGNSTIQYRTEEKEENGNIEYIHEIDTRSKALKNYLLNLLISYKRIRSNVDDTDILFKFMGSVFTLEDVRILYELIKDTSVDKSNFRKKIIKYCEKVNDIEQVKTGHRPSQKYKFKPLKGDAWV